MLTLLALSAFAADPAALQTEPPVATSGPSDTPAVPATADATDGDDDESIPEVGNGRARGGRHGHEGHPGPREPMFKVGGEFQVNFVAEHLERNGDPAYVDNPPRPTFTVAHFLPRATLDATPWLDMHAGIEFGDRAGALGARH